MLIALSPRQNPLRNAAVAIYVIAASLSTDVFVQLQLLPVILYRDPTIVLFVTDRGTRDHEARDPNKRHGHEAMVVLVEWSASRAVPGLDLFILFKAVVHWLRVGAIIAEFNMGCCRVSR